MNEKKNLSEKFKGKELWRTMNLAIVFLIYGAVIIVPLMFPQHMVSVLTIAAFILISYFAVQQKVYRKMEGKNSGRRVLTGWIDQEPDRGDEYEIPIAKVTPFSRLSISDQQGVDEFIEIEKERIQQLAFREERMGLLINTQKTTGGN